METIPWTKSECFAWNDGRRIVDLYELSKQLHCKQCSSLLDLKRTEREARYGLASILYIHCHCGVMNDVHTGRIQTAGAGDQTSPERPMYELNIKASINLLLYGAGASRILSFLALLDIPVPPPDDPSLIVPVSEDADMSSAATTSSVSSASKRRGVASTETPSFHKAPSSSAGNTDALLRSVPGPAADIDNGDSSQAADSEDVNDSHTTNDCQDDDVNEGGEEEGDNNVYDDSDDDDDGGGGGGDDDDEEYVPSGSTRLKLRLKARRPPPPPKKPVLRGPRSARATRAAKQTQQTTQKKVSKVKIKVEKIPKKKKKKVEEEEVSNAKEEEEKFNAKLFENTMDWSSTESEQGDKNSVASWNEEEEEEEEIHKEPEQEEEVSPRRKRGRPRGSTDKGKRAKRSSTPKVKKETGSKKGKEEGEEKDLPRCSTCDKDFNSIKGYNVHMKRVHNQDMKEVDAIIYICATCKQPFARDYSVLAHVDRNHWAPSRNPEDSFYTVPLKEVIKKVPREPTEEYSMLTQECLVCGESHMGKCTSARHICVDPATGKLTCVARHPDGHRLSPVQRDLLYSTALGHLCDHCGSVYSNKASFDMHLFSAHAQITERSERNKCTTCGNSFSDGSKLRVHKLTHVSSDVERTHICDACGNRFKTRLQLRSHCNRIHNKKTYVCDYCSKTYKLRAKWRVHVLQHLGESPHQCGECGQGFSSSYCLKIHAMIHTGEKPFKCQVCDAAFVQKNSIDVHMRKHRKEGHPNPTYQGPTPLKKGRRKKGAPHPALKPGKGGCGVENGEEGVSGGEGSEVSKLTGEEGRLDYQSQYMHKLSG